MPTKIYQHDETAITWLASGGSALFTPTSLAANAGRQGAHYDLGAAARSYLFAWRAWVKFSTTPIVGEIVRVYLKTSDGTNHDNDDGTGDIAVSSINKLNNLLHLGNIMVDEAATGIQMVASGEVYIGRRYIAPVFWNATADVLSATAADMGFSLTPIPQESQ